MGALESALNVMKSGGILDPGKSGLSFSAWIIMLDEFWPVGGLRIRNENEYSAPQSRLLMTVSVKDFELLSHWPLPGFMLIPKDKWCCCPPEASRREISPDGAEAPAKEVKLIVALI